ncbi:MAG: HlyD family efflux transporter periplasmic adaptor subunit [Xanthomonadales bacterium]|nr:efflux RND transporter periplasmic adaptor subunit [Gammaproteobacteria bacterium]MBT8053416.1 efflux RND transporter periplasmic adaptor subunit [Gammaproteobacteria bacterium]NND57437.1 HlyD family efflux transporter periplasmic adaptor subunit [Xanthomonadales bacterium]NNK52101.1 HlyD family efflux transporter periplasmic adaptor subunit [Xanthomonadales bacterium]
MNRLIFVFSCCLAFATLGGCGKSTSTLPSLTLETADIEFRVPAQGELIASESLPVAIPSSIRMSFNIAWMAPEFSEIRKGDVLARFDDVQVRLDREGTALNVAKSDFKLVNTEREGELEQIGIYHQTYRVEGERDITEAFANADETLLSRNEIIDALADVNYLDVEGAFLDWQLDTLDQRTRAEQNLIMAERQSELSKLEKQDTALQMMELRSPADGTFVYATTRWGAKLGKGRTVYPGMPIGLLPVRGKIGARLYVPEADAVGLAEGQTVRLRLDAATKRQFTAHITSVSPVASPRNRTDPQKFFSVEASIDDVDPDIMRVGSRLRAEVITGSINDGIVVPAQAVFGDGEETFVYVLEGGQPEERMVTLGQRSPDLVELTSGVRAGERISLVAPAERS